MSASKNLISYHVDNIDDTVKQAHHITVYDGAGNRYRIRACHKAYGSGIEILAEDGRMILLPCVSNELIIKTDE